MLVLALQFSRDGRGRVPGGTLRTSLDQSPEASSRGVRELDAGRSTYGPRRRRWRAARPGDDTDTPGPPGGKPGNVGGAWQLPQNGTVTHRLVSASGGAGSSRIPGLSPRGVLQGSDFSATAE